MIWYFDPCPTELFWQSINIIFALLFDFEMTAVVEIFRVHYNDVIMGAMTYHITSLTIVYSAVYSGED